MGSRAALVGGLAVLFAIVVLVLIKVLPGPHKSADYLVIGTLATLLCIVIVFLVNLSTSDKTRDTFYKRRK
jgi:hypothetical protein